MYRANARDIKLICVPQYLWTDGSDLGLDLLVDAVAEHENNVLGKPGAGPALFLDLTQSLGAIPVP